jgi:hypothetical protein
MSFIVNTVTSTGMATAAADTAIPTPIPQAIDSLRVVDINHNLSAHLKFYNTVNRLVAYISKIPELKKLRLDNELTLLICNLIENEIGSNRGTNKVDKQGIALQAYLKIFPDITSSDEINVIKNQIMFFWNNGSIKN